MKKRLAAVLLSFVFMASLAAAPWDINDIDEPVSQDYLSDRSMTHQVVELVDNNGNPVSRAELADEGYDFNFVYNSSSGSSSMEGNMTHLDSGYYYASFRPNFTDGMIEYELEETEPQINLTEELPVGNNTVELQNDFTQKYRAGEEVDIEVSVMDAWNGQVEDQATVHIYFTNVTSTSGLVGLGYNAQRELYTNTLRMPDNPNSSYFIHVNATTGGASYSNPQGSTSVLLETFPAITGDIDTLESDTGCNNSSFFDACERGAAIETELEITSSSAENVELDLLGVNSSGEWTELKTEELDVDGHNWTGTITVPDLNTSEYGKKLMLRYNATNSDRQFTAMRNISYRSYDIMDRGSPVAYQGASYEVELLFAKYFTLEPLNMTRFRNATVDIDDSENENLTEFMVEDMNFDSSDGLFREEIEIPSNAPPGGYSTEVTAYNIYGDRKTLSSGFNVQDIEATFNTTDLSLELDRERNYTENFTIMSKVSSEKVLDVEVKEELENFTTVNDGENITLPADGKVEVPVEFDIDNVEDHSGEITLSDPSVSFNDTVEVDLDAPDCDLRDDVLCIEEFDEDDMEVTRDERGTTTETVDLLFLGAEDGEAQITTSITGNISDYLEISPSGFTLNSSQVLTLNFTASTPGTFTGNVSINGDGDEINFSAELESDVPATETGMEAPSSLDLGYLASGDTVTEDITLDNTGEVDIDSLSVSSAEYSPSIESVSIQAGESETVELTFDSVSAESGALTITAETTEEDITTEVSVTANPVPDYAAQAETLSDRISSLSSQAENDQTVNRLQNLEADVSQIKTYYQQGDYQQAQETYQSVSTTLDTISQQVNDPQQPDGTTTEPQGGGFPILLVAAVLLVLLAIGFVAYTSIIPEEGDPLYNVMGG